MDEQPRELASISALRHALQVLPLTASEPAQADPRSATGPLLAALRAITASFLANGLHSDGDVAKARADAELAFSSLTSRGVGDAADKALAAVRAAAAAVGGPAHSAAARSAATNSADAAALVTGRRVHAVIAANSASDPFLTGFDRRDMIQLSLWPSEDDRSSPSTPTWAHRHWAGLRAWLLARGDERWHVWTDWYDARLRGDPIDWDLERARLQPPEVWEAGPKVLNAAILRRMEEIEEERQAARRAAGAASTPPPSVDDFEAVERRIASLPQSRDVLEPAAPEMADVMERLRNLEALLEDRKPAPGEIGHNEPPPDQRLSSEMVAEGRAATGALRSELEGQAPDAASTARHATRLARLYEAIGPAPGVFGVAVLTGAGLAVGDGLIGFATSDAVANALADLLHSLWHLLQRVFPANPAPSGPPSISV